jgi:hypothetical protein
MMVLGYGMVWGDFYESRAKKNIVLGFEREKYQIKNCFK